MAQTTIKLNDEGKPLNPKDVREMRRKRRKQRRNIILGAAGFLVLVIWYLTLPLTAGISYGICRTYLELNIKYPTSYTLTQYDEFGQSTRIFYTYTNEFGSNRSEMLECIVTPDGAGGYIVEDIKVDRVSIGEEAVRLFNLSLPAVLANNPDLKIPFSPGETLLSLKPP